MLWEIFKTFCKMLRSSVVWRFDSIYMYLIVGAYFAINVWITNQSRSFNNKILQL